jgi:hypothetical protein
MYKNNKHGCLTAWAKPTPRNSRLVYAPLTPRRLPHAMVQARPRRLRRL